jgi:hypothetical protein
MLSTSNSQPNLESEKVSTPSTPHPSGPHLIASSRSLIPPLLLASKNPFPKRKPSVGIHADEYTYAPPDTPKEKSKETASAKVEGGLKWWPQTVVMKKNTKEQVKMRAYRVQ